MLRKFSGVRKTKGKRVPACKGTSDEKKGILPAYTIARAISRPIKADFAGAGCRVGELLRNNTNIGGSLASTNSGTRDCIQVSEAGRLSIAESGTTSVLW